MFRKFFDDKEFFRQFIRITLPVAGQNFIIFAVSMADTVMVGRLGEVQLSSVALANQLGFFMNMMIFGLCGGANVMIAQYWGKQDIKSIHKIMTLMYRCLAVIVVVFTALAMLFPRQVMMVFTDIPQVIEGGVEFIRYVALGYIATGFATGTLFVLRSVGTVNISIVVYLSSLVTNIFLNWVLIFGNLGAPAMGIKGAAIATACARIVELVIVLAYMMRFETQLCYSIKYFFMRKIKFLREFIKNALPIFINELFWGLGAAMISVVIGRMGTEFTAANSVCSVLSQLVTVAIFGAGSASSVIIGNTVGAGYYELAKKRASKLLIISGSMGVFAMILVFLLKKPMLLLYNISDLAKVYANQIMIVYAFVVLFQSVAMVAVVGVLRGGGDGKFAAMIDVLTMWGISIPFGFLCGLVWGLPVPVVYAVLKMDEVFKTVLALPRLIKGKWVKDLTQNTPE